MAVYSAQLNECAAYRTLFNQSVKTLPFHFDGITCRRGSALHCVMDSGR
jgi:hypothetical protein